MRVKIMYEFQVSAFSEEKIQHFFQEVKALDTSIEDWTGVYTEPSDTGEIFGFGATSLDLESLNEYAERSGIELSYVANHEA
jgi:hypothetical protein